MGTRTKPAKAATATTEATATITTAATATAATAATPSVTEAATATITAAILATEATEASVTEAVTAAVRPLNDATRRAVLSAVVAVPGVMVAATAAVAVPLITAAPRGRDPREVITATAAEAVRMAAAMLGLCGLAGITLPAESITPTDADFDRAAAVLNRGTAAGTASRPGPVGGPRTLAELAAVTATVTLAATATRAAVTAAVTAEAVTIGGQSFTSLSAAARHGLAAKSVNGWDAFTLADGRTAAAAVDAARAAATA